jgi:hypothetical protein
MIMAVKIGATGQIASGFTGRISRKVAILQLS